LVGGGFSIGCHILPGLMEPVTLPALLHHHEAWPGLLLSSPATFHFNMVGDVGLAAWAIMNLVHLLSFEFVLLWASCSIETCSVNCMMVNICELTVFASAVGAVLRVSVAFDTVFCCGWQVLMELIAVFTVKMESDTDSSLTLIFCA